MTEQDVCILLNLTSGIGYSKFIALKEKAGSILKIPSLDLNSIRTTNGIGKVIAENFLSTLNSCKLQEEKKIADNAGARIITIVDDEYPQQLKEIPDPPLCLYAKGILNCEFSKSIGVVGTRRITYYGREMTESLVSSLANADFTIVSGLAYGVDAAAHKATVNSNGRTIAVLGGGLARLHPQDHLQLARDIIDKGGAVVSEFPMEFPPNKKTFPMRNRIISGLCSGLLVIEAGVKSGSLITANFALNQGRTVYAVPGNANSPLSRGCNKLIREGAKLTETLEDIIQELEFLPGFNNLGDFKKTGQEQSIQLNEIENKVVTVIKNEDKSLDQIAVETSLPLGVLLLNIQNLELKKVIKQLPGKRYKAV